MMINITARSDELKDLRRFSRITKDHRREVEWFHTVRGFNSDEGLRWIIGRFSEFQEHIRND